MLREMVLFQIKSLTLFAIAMVHVKTERDEQMNIKEENGLKYTKKLNSI